MFKKIFLTLVLVLSGSLTASAQEYQYIGIQGSWWNQNYAGEGFALEEYGDGFMVGYWYTYGLMGEQMWLLGTGERDGNTVVLEMIRTHGGILAHPTNPEGVTEEQWGTVTLEILDCTHIEMSYQRLDGESGGYPITRLLRAPLAAGSCNSVQVESNEPPPETDPPEEPPEEEPPVEPTVDIRLQKLSATGQWEDVEIPFTGLAVIHKTYVGSPDRITLFRFRVVAEDGDLVFGSITAQEPTGVSQPTVEGIWPGLSFAEGSEVEFRLDSNLTGGLRVYPHYSAFVEGYGEILNLTVRLSTQTQ